MICHATNCNTDAAPGNYYCERCWEEISAETVPTSGCLAYRVAIVISVLFLCVGVAGLFLGGE